MKTDDSTPLKPDTRDFGFSLRAPFIINAEECTIEALCAFALACRPVVKLSPPEIEIERRLVNWGYLSQRHKTANGEEFVGSMPVDGMPKLSFRGST